MAPARAGRASIAASLVAVATLLSGCTSSAAAPDFVSAMRLADDAQAAGVAWAPDARLVGAFTMEPTPERAGGGSPGNAWWNAVTRLEDPVLGDGLAQAWIYSFASESRPGVLYRVALAADGRYLHQDEVAWPGTAFNLEDERIVDWLVDSPEASAALRGAHEEIVPLLLYRTTNIYYALDRDDGRDPYWAMWTGRLEDRSWARHLNARDPSLGPPGGDPGFGPAEGGWMRAETDLLSEPAALTFTVEESLHVRVDVAVDFDLAPPGTLVTLRLEAPDGARQELGWAAGTFPREGRQTFAWNDPPEGDWSLTVRLDQGLEQAFWVAWCARGEGDVPPGGPSAQDPCDATAQPL